MEDNEIINKAYTCAMHSINTIQSKELKLQNQTEFKVQV